MAIKPVLSLGSSDSQDFTLNEHDEPLADYRTGENKEPRIKHWAHGGGSVQDKSFQYKDTIPQRKF